MALPVQADPDGEGGAVDQDHTIAITSVRCLEAFTNITTQLTHDQNVITRIPILFKQPNVDKLIMTPDDIHDSHEQFMVWTKNLGVFASDHGSLDFRLGGAEDARDSIVLLLQNLSVDLSTCSQLLAKDRSTVSNDDCDTSSDSSTSSNADCQLDMLSSSATRKTVYELQIRISHVVEVVNKLIKLASVIRASGSRSRMTRALAYEHIQDGVNVTEQFEKHCLPQVLEHRFGLTGEILSRFVRAISLRRKHFLYQSRHQKRLAYNSGLPAEMLQNLPLPKPGATKAAIDPNSLISAQTNQKSAVTQILSDLNPPTKATTFGTLQSEKKAPSRLTSGSTKLDKNDHNIPPPPPVKDKATHFECPYCCTLIPREKREPKYWRAHVIADLKPFVCLEPDCPNPDVLLESQGHWVEHQKWEHALEWWCDGIDNEHTARCFASEEAFAQHLRHAHKGTMSSQAISSEVTIAGRPSLTPFNCCPLCDFSPPRADQLEPVPTMNSVMHLTYTQSQLQKHIGNEMLGIFLTALPDRDDIECPDIESVLQGGKRSTLLTVSTVSTHSNNRNHYTLEPRGEDLTIPATWFVLEQDYLRHGLGETSFDELWDDVWASPPLRKGIRATYEGLANDTLATQWQATERYLASFVDSLAFEHINRTTDRIAPAQMGSYQWLFKCPEYQDWLDTSKLSRHHGLFWIKGKPGTGKSTVMKFLLSDANRNMRDSAVISFFFNARGQGLERSAAGMYRSLLFQLLKQLTDLRSIIDIPQVTVEEMFSIQWTSEQLQVFLTDAIKGLRKRSLTCFIDALDECDGEEGREIVTFFGHLTQLAYSSKTEFRACLSSRHYPTLIPKKGLSIILEQLTMYDIANYVGQRLQLGQEQDLETIRQEITARSNGIFLWVVLVIQILNKEYNDGRDVRHLRKRLQAIPLGLADLFSSILDREYEYFDEMSLCFYWVLFAQRPLTIQELYVAVLTGINPENVKPWDPDEVTEAAITTAITTWSCGLIETTGETEKISQFVHVTVRDYLLSHNSLNLTEGMSGSTGKVHDTLRQCCHNYYKSQYVTDFMEGRPMKPASLSAGGTINPSKLARRIFPFLEYAVEYLLHHSDLAQAQGCSQSDFLNQFEIRRWIEIDDLLDRHRVYRYSTTVSLLYILAEKDLSSLIQLEMNRVSCMDIPGERYGLPLLAAKELGNRAALRAMLFYRPPKNSQDENDQPSPSADEIDKVVDILLVARPLNWKDGETPIKWAIDNDLEPLVKCLLATTKVSCDADLGLGLGQNGRKIEKDNV